MNLRQLKDDGWLKAKSTSREEIGNLLAIVERDLKDACASISPDWRFGIAYNAALKLCTVLLRAQGYRPAPSRPHYYTIRSMSIILGEAWKKDADYLDACRIKRNSVEYDRVGGASEAEASELLSFANEFRASVLTWLKDNHPELLCSQE